MGRVRRIVKRPKLKTTEQYDSDDSAKYRDMPVPDKKSSSYLEDEIDQFHNRKILKLLTEGVEMDSDQGEMADEDEVMPLSDSEEEEEEEEREETDMESDLEGKEDGLPNDMAWGFRKKVFYDSDYTAVKGKSQEEVEVEDQEEEQEAMKIQERLVGVLSEEDYDLTLLQEFAPKEEDEQEEKAGKEQKIVKDLKKMSQKEKLKLLKKESPEFLELIQDFKSKLAELRDEVQPLLEMVKDGRLPDGKGAEYLKTKQQLYLNYCTNISFYLVLKAKRIPAHNHPVIERLVSYRNLINDLTEVDARVAPQLRQLLSEVHQGVVTVRSANSKHNDSASKKDAAGTDESKTGEQPESDSEVDEEAALHFYRQVEARLKRKNEEPLAEEKEEDEEDVDPDAKRAITYQMAKNKGLTPKRKKIDRNPRVKHREKYRRAKIRRKGQVREVYREEQRYGGELSGIRAGVKKSIKLK